jgi:beta-galactosidase
LREILRLDSGWLFHLGDIESPVPTDKHIAAYMANKAGWARGAAKPAYDDSDWRSVDLPHDWSIEGAIDRGNYVDNGFLPRGIGWYRRHFRLDEADRGRFLALSFDGVSSHCIVYVNGHLLHRNFCGYTSFTVDISDIARFGEEANTIAIRVDATPIEGWWYEGAGIYRHVRLTKSDRMHVAPDGVLVYAEPAPSIPHSVTDARSAVEWNVRVHVTIENTSDRDQQFAVKAEVIDSTGEVLAHKCAFWGMARGLRQFHECLTVSRPSLWSLSNPVLYRLRISIRRNGLLIDETVTPFGFRTVRFDPDHGFFLNDESVKLKGTCNHQDHAGVGVAVPDSIHEFRIRRLKEMGCNAYRCAHHPPAPELLDACDRLGMLVIDENRTFGSSPGHLEQLGAMVRRDRNHPCIIAWSICNEEAIQGTPEGANIARAMMHHIKSLDPSRAITAGVSGGILNDNCIADVIEVIGINYQLPLQDSYHAKHPHTPLQASETHCVLSTRGTYQTDPSRYQFASDDTEITPWGASARQTWGHVRERDFVAGLFVWSGFDYRGEPTPHGWPCVSSQLGMMDTCGFAKDAFFRHRAFFSAEPFIHISPHWNRPGREGEVMNAIAYTNCHQAELFLNEQSLGRKEVDPIEMASWEVPYAPGVLRAVGFNEGKQCAETIIETTGPAVSLGLEIHPSMHAVCIPADGQFAIPVTVFALDSSARRVPDSADFVTFTIDGPGRIIGVGNGDPTCHEPDKASARSLFRGLAQVIVQTTSAAGEITLHATARGLVPAKLAIRSQPATRMPDVPNSPRRWFITDWRMSPITLDRPDVHARLLEQDVNTWDRIEPGKPQSAWSAARGYAIYRASASLPRIVQSHGGRIVFHELGGNVEVFVGGAGPLDGSNVPIEPGQREIGISLLIQGFGVKVGLLGKVEIMPNTPSPG